MRGGATTMKTSTHSDQVNESLPPKILYPDPELTPYISKLYTLSQITALEMASWAKSWPWKWDPEPNHDLENDTLMGGTSPTPRYGSAPPGHSLEYPPQ